MIKYWSGTLQPVNTAPFTCYTGVVFILRGDTKFKKTVSTAMIKYINTNIIIDMFGMRTAENDSEEK